MNDRLVNLIILLFLFVIGVAALYLLTRKNDYDFEAEDKSPFEIKYLVHGVNKAFNDILNRNISEFNLNRVESLKREENKALLREALKNCNYGDIGAKEYVVDYIKEILQKKFEINPATIGKVICFNKKSLSVQDKFEIILQQYKKQYKYNALKEIIIRYDLAKAKNDGRYQIDSKDIEDIFNTEGYELDYDDKLDIVARRVYQKSKGLSVCDELRNMVIDEFAGGISGIPEGFYNYDLDMVEYVKEKKLNSYDSVWIVFQGKDIRLSFLSFGSNKELIRTCKNIYRYDNPGQLSESKGYILNESKDGARIVVFRPKFSAGWAFYLRRYDSLEKKTLEACIPDRGCEKVIQLLQYLVRGEMLLMITGEMGSGKTMLLLAMIGALKSNCNVRTFEQIFELYINKYFPEMNVLSLRKIDGISTEEAFAILRKTNGKAIIMGEVTTHEEANQMMEINQINEETIIGTAHMPTVEKLMDYFTDAKLNAGHYNDAKRAEKKVVETLNIDIHLRNDNGHRYIERITEIIPLEEGDYPDDLHEAMKEFMKRVTAYKTYRAVDIMRYEDGQYQIVNPLSQKIQNKICKKLDVEGKDRFHKLFDGMGVDGE